MHPIRNYQKQRMRLVEENVVDKEKQLLELIQSNKRISAQEMAAKLQIAPRTVQRYLKLLQDKGRLERKVFCFGVLQHTPDVNKSVQCLAEMVKPGGELAVDFYPIRGWCKNSY